MSTHEDPASRHHRHHPAEEGCRVCAAGEPASHPSKCQVLAQPPPFLSPQQLPTAHGAMRSSPPRPAPVLAPARRSGVSKPGSRDKTAPNACAGGLGFLGTPSPGLQARQQQEEVRLGCGNLLPEHTARRHGPGPDRCWGHCDSPEGPYTGLQKQVMRPDRKRSGSLRFFEETDLGRRDEEHSRAVLGDQV